MPKTDTSARKKNRVGEYEATTKRPMVGVSLGYPFYDEVKRACDDEPVKLAAFVLEVFRCGWRSYQRVGSLKALKALDKIAASASVASKKYSAETCEELATMINLILERAPSTVVKKMTEKLSEWASTYSDSQK